ncbi:hypothetical protein [Kibdelosporangium phytohabitans]|uniref:WXG100 family type VII secretion target n=1 Tax=Kibdelosporangium phytohabitans TaxID=860235 RepID=A0A0N9I4X9_9PSEU|nr:hypothetical protein [Kibdelosporangium phytohabitans]ALG13841.1 hypothetical protein AOZ06_49480 [Kibdelosporangium phytohabitans]MBE1467230.1 hypothetical protein [Kibdelosporangium phytohabitans]
MSDALAGPIKQAIVGPNEDSRDTSDVQLSNAKWFADFMSNEMGGLYNLWCSNPCAAGDLQYGTGNKVLAMNADGMPEKTSMPQLAGINWGLIADAKARFESLAKVAAAASQSTTNGVNGIHSAWPDKAGAKAADKFNELATPLKDFGTTCDTIAKAAGGLWNVSRQPIYDLGAYQQKPITDMINKYRGINFGDKRRLIENLDKARQLGREGENWTVVENDWDGDGTGPISPADLRSQPGLVDINADHSGEIWADAFCREMDEFGYFYRNATVSFRQLIENAYKAASNGLYAFSEAMRANTAMFAGLQAPGTGGGDKKDPKETGGGPKETGGGPKETGGGPKETGGGPKNTGGGYQPPPLPEPDADTPPSKTDPAGVDPAKDPTATDPTKDPTATDPTKDVPGTGVPGTGMDGGAGKPTGGETVTIDEGGHKISVTSPDSNGHVKVTVDDGTGKPKTYDMDFSQPGTGAPGTPGTGTPGQQNPVQFGPDGQPVQTLPAPAGGDPAAETLKPGPDGKIVLQDGDVKITAEHPPGQPDQVRLTIDDGTGEPTSYLLDYSDKDGGAQALKAEPAYATLDGSQNIADRQAAQAQGFAGGGSDGSGVPAGAGAASGASAAAAEASAVGGGSSGGAQEQPLQSVPGSDQPVQTTSTQAVASDFGGGGNGFADSGWSTQGDLLSGDDGSQVAPAAGEAGLASVPDDGAQQPHAAQANGSAPMGGMPMGGMGAGGAGGGDTERSGGQWSVAGDLFAEDELSEPARIAGVLDDDAR